GLYSIYWSYQNWSLYKKSVGSDVWPIARGIFDILFLHSLCDKISSLISSSQKERSALEWQAIQYVLLVIVSGICDRLAMKELGLPYTHFASFFILPFAYRALYKIQLRINYAMKDDFGEANARFSWANYVWIILGILLCLVTILDGLDSVVI
ncbi:hypothetical protein CAG70_04085, partial [Photobacterium halotolerans]|uniref:hypothetical protein n=2 Tax=Photobacterium TaxID=657 RepID=UPI001372EF8E